MNNYFMSRLTSILILLVVSTSSAFAKDLSSDNVIGSTLSVASEALGQVRELDIYLPEGYDNSKKSYPVVYILDSQRYFLHGVSYQISGKFQAQVPDFIVVGIKTKNKESNSLFVNQPERFTQFIQDELLPLIKSRFRTNQDRIIFGWERAGMYAIHLMSEKPDLFNAYLVASPTMLRPNKIAAVKSRLEKGFNNEKFFHFALSPVEAWSTGSTDALAKVLDEMKIDNLRWSYQQLEGEDHYSTPIRVIHQGLRDYFNDYPTVRFYSIKAFEDAGGIKALKKHYQKRGARYGLSKEIHDDTKRYLLIQTYYDEDYQTFLKLMKEFKGGLKSYSRDIWFGRFGQFSLENRLPDEAIKLFDMGLGKFPKSADLLNGMGDSYRMKGDRSAAIDYYQRAISQAKKNNNRNLDAYKKDLEDLTK